MTDIEANDDPLATLEPLLRRADGGDPGATDALFALLYDELHRLAKSQLRRARPEIGVSATTLLHELYVAMSRRREEDSSALAGTAAVPKPPPRFPDRGRFMAYAARAMRGIVIDAIRARRADKRGGQFHITALSTKAEGIAQSADELTRLADALDLLATTDPALAEIVNLNFFGGLGFEEIAALRGVSERTVQRDWRKARLFLKSALMDS